MLINVSFFIKYVTLSHTWYINNFLYVSRGGPFNHLGILYLKRKFFHQHTHAMMLAYNINKTCCLTTIVITTSDTRICRILSNIFDNNVWTWGNLKHTLKDYHTRLRTITQMNLNITSSSKILRHLIYKLFFLYITQHPFF